MLLKPCFQRKHLEEEELPEEVTPAMHSAAFLQEALRDSASDKMIEWLVQVAESPVSAFALEIACRNDWWRTTLPILLKSKHAPDDAVVLQYAVLHPEQLAVLPQQFSDAGLELRLSPMSWIATATHAAYSGIDDAEMAAVRAAMEPLFVADNRWMHQMNLKTWRIGSAVSISKTNLFYPRPVAEKTVDLQTHVDWMNSVVRGVPEIVL